MRNFYIEYRNNEILQPLVAEISWTKNIIIMENGDKFVDTQYLVHFYFT